MQKGFKRCWCKQAPFLYQKRIVLATNIIQKGKLLVSEISLLQDPSFARSVIFITEHTSQGSTGFVLNKPLETSISKLVSELFLDFPIYIGGPVEEKNLFYIHTIPELIPDSDEISDGIYLGGDFDEVIRLAREGNLTKKNIRFFLGHAGWTVNQLESEVEEKSWVVIDNTYKSDILSKSTSNLWKKQIESFGERYIIWSNAPEDPCDN